ncbi:hypothetical protein [Halomonas sp. A29]|uniref:hypothetical protein n=1 Tax=Halomonas sp. A29 TaxID=3102786 RepID=UPI00398A9D19
MAQGGWGLSDFNAARKALSQLGDTILASGAALLGQEAADQAAQGRPIAPRSGMMVRYARLLQIDSLVTTSDASFESGANYVVEMEVSMGDYRRTVSYLANPDGSPRRSRNGETQYVDTLENGERIGGNLPEPDVTDNTRVRMLWQVRDTDLAQVAGYVEGVSAEGLSAGGEPVRIPMVDQQLLMAEQQRSRGRMSGGDKTVQLLEAVFALVSFYDVGKSLADKPKSLEHWWGMLGAMAALTQIAMDVAAGIEVRRGLAASGNLAYERVARGTQYGSAAKHLGRVVAAIGIIDGFRALAEAGAMARRGELRSRVRTKAFLGGIAIAGGILAIAVGSLVLIPLIIGVILLIGAYWLVRLVPRNIELWLRRSLYGLEREQLPFQPFANGQEEQQSLMMVFSGIEFDMEVDYRLDTPEAMMAAYTAEAARALRSRYITLTTRFPSELAGELTVLITYQSVAGQRQYLGGTRYANGDVVSVGRHGQVENRSNLIGAGMPLSTRSERNSFELEQDGEEKIIRFEKNLQSGSGLLVAEVLYYPEVGGLKRDIFEMRL